MENNTERLIESKKMIKLLANGINPLDHTPVRESCLLNDPRIIRQLFFLSEYLENDVTTKKSTKRKPSTFIISKEEKDQVELPVGLIGINEFAQAINKVINLDVSKKLNGAVINRKLRSMGILSVETVDNGKKRTVPNDKSAGYGIESITKHYNNEQYQQVVFNDIGKKFLLDNIESILSYK
ncbi:hypothetical protein [Bacillus alkalisoli]|nr:hypothetical protein [Bacillus alkalisoli]